MKELNDSFYNYISELKKLPLEEKREELISSIKELIAVFDHLSNQKNIDVHYLKNNEILDLNKEFVSEDDFIEAAVVYIEVAKNIIAEYLMKEEIDLN